MRSRVLPLFLLLLAPIVLAGCTTSVPTQSSPAAVALGPAGQPSVGDARAPVTFVAFESPRCTGCRAFHLQGGPGNSSFDRLLATYVANGSVRFVDRTFYLGYDVERPLANAQKCAWHLGGSGAYGNLSTNIYQQLPNLSARNVDAFLETFGVLEDLSDTGFRACANARTHEAEIERDLADARAQGIQGTPTFFIIAAGDPEPVRLDGVPTYERLSAALDAALSRAAR